MSLYYANLMHPRELEEGTCWCILFIWGILIQCWEKSLGNVLQALPLLTCFFFSSPANISGQMICTECYRLSSSFSHILIFCQNSDWFFYESPPTAHRNVFRVADYSPNSRRTLFAPGELLYLVPVIASNMFLLVNSG